MDLSSTTVVVVLMVEFSVGQGFAKPCKRERRRRWRGRAWGGLVPHPLLPFYRWRAREAALRCAAPPPLSSLYRGRLGLGGRTLLGPAALGCLSPQGSP